MMQIMMKGMPRITMTISIPTLTLLPRMTMTTMYSYVDFIPRMTITIKYSYVDFIAENAYDDYVFLR